MTKKIILLILLSFTVSNAQIERETRAVWIAANFRLDWPPPVYNADEQKQSLIDILDNVERKNLNTIYFQVRYNATVLFESSYDPWSFYLTGEVGGTPSYDPLDFVIREAHKRGIEVHAWFNMVRCFNGSEQNVFEYPGHVLNTHPEWIRKVVNEGQTSYWLDPGIPEVQNYLSNVVIDLAEKYEIDGIQLDFIRYPSRDMNDSDTYAKYGNGKEIGQWRRDNITAIVRNISKVVNMIDPDIKLGATPLGVYTNKPAATGLQAYSEVYQESRTWLKQGLLDYLVPQLYWNFEDNPRFNLLVDDWVSRSASRNVVIGIASYKPEVRSETRRMIEYSKSAGASGVAFFRYSFIADENYFKNKSFPAAMAWKAPGKPSAPQNLSVSVLNKDENKYSLTWIIQKQLSGQDDIKYFSVYNPYRISDKLSSENLFRIVPSNSNSLSFTVPYPTRVKYYFTVKSLNKFWNESKGSTNTAVADVASLQTMADNLVLPAKTVLLKNNNNTYIVLTSDEEDIVNIEDGSGISARKEITPGFNIIGLDSGMNSNSIYINFKNSGKRLNLNQ